VCGVWCVLVAHHPGDDGDDCDDDDCSCHCVSLFLVVSCMLVLYQVIGTMSSPILGLDLAPPLPLEAVSNPQPHDCHCCRHADCK